MRPSILGSLISIFQVTFLGGIFALGLLVLGDPDTGDFLPPDYGPVLSEKASVHGSPNHGVPSTWLGLLGKSFRQSTMAYIPSQSSGTLQIAYGDTRVMSTHLAERATTLRLTAEQGSGVKVHLAAEKIPNHPTVTLVPTDSPQSVLFVDPVYRTLLRIQWRIIAADSEFRVEYGWSWHPDKFMNRPSPSVPDPTQDLSSVVLSPLLAG